MSPRPLYTAFSFDYQSRKREIITPCKIDNPHAPSATSLESTALWDTGAIHSVVNLSIVKSLQLVTVFREMISGVHGAQEADGHIVEIT